MATRWTIPSLAALACSGCLAPPVASSPSNNSQIEVETLFTHDGCTVFRFYDAGYHYYARCEDARVSVATMSDVSCGRNCVQQEEVPTVAASALQKRASKQP